MKKKRYPASQEPLDLDSFLANFIEEHKEARPGQSGHNVNVSAHPDKAEHQQEEPFP